MSSIAALFGALMVLMGLLALFAPDKVLSLVEWEARRWVWIAAGLRIVIGLVLLATAARSRAPGAMLAFGGIALVAGAVTPFVPKERWEALIRWWRDQNSGIYRAAGLVALAFGAFVSWANLP